MAKIFATKALSMVLCFVMLFMGAPVTTWAEDDLYITTKGCSSGMTALWIAPGESNKVELFYGGSHAEDAKLAGGVTWSSSDTSETYVKLLTGGYVQGVSATPDGTPVTITATSKDDATKTATISVVVTSAVNSVTIADWDGTDVTGAAVEFDLAEEYYSLSAAALDSSSKAISGAAIQWSSSNKDVVTVDASGELTVVAEGTATVTASCAGKSASVTVTITDDEDGDGPGGGSFFISDSDGKPLDGLELSVGEVYELFYSGSAVEVEDFGAVTFSSSDTSVATVTEDHGFVLAKKAGTTIITAKDSSGAYSASVTVTVVEGSPVSSLDFEALSPVYNKDLALKRTPWARKHMMIGTISADSQLAYFDSITVVNSHGETTVDKGHWDDLLCDDEWALSAAEGVHGEDVAPSEEVDGLRDVGYLAKDRLPVCLDMPEYFEVPGGGGTVLDVFSLGKNTITLTTLGGDSYTTYITIAQTEPQVGAQWTKGSSEGLLIAKIPNLNEDLLDTLITNLVIKQDGTRFFDGQPVSEILTVDSETGDVYIKKEILDPLDPGTYAIGFKAGDGEELFNFVVVAADPDSDSEVRTLSTDVTISVGGVEKNQKIMVRDINNILSDDTQLHVEVASEAHDELDVPIFDVEHGFHYNVKLLDAAGDELPMPLSAKVELLFECVEGLDIGQLEIVLADSLTDTQFEEDYQTYGDVQYVGVLTNHFSPYSLLDIQTEDEKAALGKGKNNVKTGDQAVQVAVAGFGSILVLALGIMLRLITSKKKFEE